MLQTFFVLNSAENEILPAIKSKITNSCKFFLAQLSMKNSLLINMKMPTTVFALISAHTPISALLSNSVVFRLLPEYFLSTSV